MKREGIKAMLPILQAFADGKVIQMLDNRSIWTDLTEREGLPIGTLREEPNSFRIKPEPKYRPFANAEECWQEMQKHQPFGYTYDRFNGIRDCITKVATTGVSYDSPTVVISFEEVFDKFVFADGVPFGIKVE
jgi:hypothetical protein